MTLMNGGQQLEWAERAELPDLGRGATGRTSMVQSE